MPQSLKHQANEGWLVLRNSLRISAFIFLLADATRTTHIPHVLYVYTYALITLFIRTMYAGSLHGNIKTDLLIGLVVRGAWALRRQYMPHHWLVPRCAEMYLCSTLLCGNLASRNLALSEVVRKRVCRFACSPKKCITKVAAIVFCRIRRKQLTTGTSGKWETMPKDCWLQVLPFLSGNDFLAAKRTCSTWGKRAAEHRGTFQNMRINLLNPSSQWPMETVERIASASVKIDALNREDKTKISRCVALGKLDLICVDPRDSADHFLKGLPANNQVRAVNLKCKFFRTETFDLLTKLSHLKRLRVSSFESHDLSIKEFYRSTPIHQWKMRTLLEHVPTPRHARISYVHPISTLSELVFYKIDLSVHSVFLLSELTELATLKIVACSGVDWHLMDATFPVIPALRLVAFVNSFKHTRARFPAECLSRQKNIRRIRVTGVPVTRTATAQLGELKFLESLSVDVYHFGNDLFFDEENDGFGALTHLSIRTHLPLPEKQLVHLSALKNLEEVDIRTEHLSGTCLGKGFGSCVRLKALRLFNISFLKCSLNNLSLVRTLRKLVLSGTKIDAEDLGHIASVSGLIALEFGSTTVFEITTEKQFTEMMVRLQRLVYFGAAFYHTTQRGIRTDAFMRSLAFGNQLEFVHLPKWTLKGQDMQYLKQLTKLKCLTINNFALTAEVASLFAKELHNNATIGPCLDVLRSLH